MRKALIGLFFMMQLAAVYATPSNGSTAEVTSTALVDSTDQCCAYALHLVNLYQDGHIKSVRVTGICGTSLCCSDPDEWNEDADLPTSVEWSPPGGVGIPYGKAIDNDFMVYLDRATSPHTIQVEWLDLAGNIVCRQIIQISCDGPFDEDEDWMKYTQTTPLDDPNLFVFATREDEDDDEGDCDWGATAMSIVPCSFDFSVSCSGGNTYVVTLNGPAGFSTFSWNIERGPSTPAIGGGQNPTFSTNQSGSYIISLMAINPTTKDTCFSDKDIIIPKFEPDFDWEILPCQTGVKFTAKGWDDLSDISNITWSSSNLSGLPGSGTVVTSPNPGNGIYQVTMTITDKYGCSHSITKTISVDNVCHPGLKVEKFTFCPSNCTGKSTTNILVTFRNTSTGGVCPITYTWNFGDGTPSVTTNHNQPIVTHMYTVSCPTGQSFSVSIVMHDAASTPCNTSAAIVANIVPCNVDFDFVVCPDGRVNFNANMKGTWDFPGHIALAPWPYSDFSLDGKHQRRVVRYGSGTHTVTFTGSCDGIGECSISKQVVVNLDCCAKNDRDHSTTRFSASGNDFKMKSRFAQNQFPFVHNIKANTKLKKKKTKWGISFWKGSNADVIEASFAGTIFKRDADHCNCTVPNNVSESEIRSNKKRAKAKDGWIGRFRTRVNSISSTHQVTVGGQTETAHLFLGHDCDEFRWWLDWF